MEAARAATTADLPRLADLVRGVTAELEITRGGAVWRSRESRQEPIEASLEKLLSDPKGRLLAATIDDVIVGYAAAHIERLADGSRLGVVDDIYVEEGARGVGLGEAMMDVLVSWCETEGCIGMDAMALPGHRHTKNFFEESGFTARQLIMHKPMPPAAPAIRVEALGDEA
ncbi:MAG: GNAT family N-acetyltransferase [Actinomycetota bacterium]|nr:GNAT family N-acetyltransferase [Actinomycetota bacterium]